MSLITRKSTSLTPEALQDQLRSAQSDHAAAIAAANQQLLDTHESVLTTATDRRATIDEQVRLLDAERNALLPVIKSAGEAPLAER